MATRSLGDKTFKGTTGVAKPYQLIFLSGNGQLGTFDFAVAPEQVQIVLPERGIIVPTLRGFHIDDFGDGPMTLTIQGHFGWNKKSTLASGEMTGKQYHARLAALQQRRLELEKRIGTDPNDYLIMFVDSVFGNVLKCIMPEFRSTMDHQKPLIVNYSMSLAVVQKISLFRSLPGVNVQAATASVKSGEVTGQTQGVPRVNTIDPTQGQRIAVTIGTAVALPIDVASGAQTPVDVIKGAFNTTNQAYVDRFFDLNATSSLRRNQPILTSGALVPDRNSDASLPFDGTYRDWRK